MTDPHTDATVDSTRPVGWHRLAGQPDVEGYWDGARWADHRERGSQPALDDRPGLDDAAASRPEHQTSLESRNPGWYAVAGQRGVEVYWDGSGWADYRSAGTGSTSPGDSVSGTGPAGRASGWYPVQGRPDVEVHWDGAAWDAIRETLDQAKPDAST